MTGWAGGYAENYADSVLPPEGDVEDCTTAPVGDAMTWWQWWSAIREAYEAGWDRAMERAREQLR